MTVIATMLALALAGAPAPGAGGVAWARHAASPESSAPPAEGEVAEAEVEVEAEPETEAPAQPDAGAVADPQPAPAASPARPPQFGRAGDPEDTPPPTPDDPDFAHTPGGYWGPTDTKQLPPPDGKRNILIGSIVGPLGVLAASTGAAFTYLTVPEHCVERMAGIGLPTQQSRCRGLFALNIVRTSYGGLMVITGAVLLAIGLRQRAKRREWDRHHSSAASRSQRLGLAPGGLAIHF